MSAVPPRPRAGPVPDRDHHLAVVDDALAGGEERLLGGFRVVSSRRGRPGDRNAARSSSAANVRSWPRHGTSWRRPPIRSSSLATSWSAPAASDVMTSSGSTWRGCPARRPRRTRACGAGASRCRSPRGPSQPALLGDLPVVPAEGREPARLALHRGEVHVVRVHRLTSLAARYFWSVEKTRSCSGSRGSPTARRRDRARTGGPRPGTARRSA